MKEATKELTTECINCKDGMGVYNNADGTKGQHRVSIEVPLREFAGVKVGELIPHLKCRRCDKEKLIRTL